MELTTSYQKLGEAYLGNSSGNLYIRIYAKINSQSVQNNTSNISYQSRLYFSGSYIISQGQTKVEMRGSNISNTTTTWQNFEGSQNGRFNNGETTVKTITTTITHNADGTASINASAIFSSSGSWGWVGTATGSATLPSLHKPPVIETADIVETNADMISLGVPNTTIVPYLSEKTITLHGTASDDATLSYKLEHVGTDYVIPADGFQASNVFNTNYRLNNITYDANNKARIIQRFHDSLNGEASNWLFVTINDSVEQPNVIPYNKPIIERASTSIRRKSGVYSETLQRVANLTDNITSLNLKATIYKGDDAIGNNNSLVTIGYKVWATDDTEPVSYTAVSPLPTQDSDGNVTISDFEIANILFTKVYNYKIIVTDGYSYSDEILDGRISIGQPLWTEYKDRVDFLKITQQGSNVLAEGDVLYEGSLQGGNSTSIDMTNYSRLRIYAISFSTQFFFDLDLTETVSSPLTSGRSYVSSGVGSYYSTSQSALEYHMCCVEVNDAKTTLYNTTMGYLRGSTTNLRNNSSDYYIYKVVGYK